MDTTAPVLKASPQDTQQLHENASALYESLPIRGQNVRIITLLPGLPSEAVTCSLVVRSLKDLDAEDVSQLSLPQSHLPRFEALSYAWGEPNFTHPIICNGHPLAVTSNLYSALLHLRYKTSSRLLWIDQICINQFDIIERNSQLRNVGRIYKLAQNVIAWLGDESLESTRLMKTLENYGFRDTSNREDPGRLCFGYITDEINSLLRRPWFQRIWVRQEIALAQRVSVHCGGYSIPILALKLSLAAIAQKQTRWGLELMDEHSCAVVSGLDTGWARFGTHGLLDLLNKHRIYEATDPRDKVYGLLGMANDNFVDMLDSDYEKPIIEVFENLAKFLINRDGNLDIIYAAEGQIPILSTWRLKLPSWVPDWTAKPAAPSLLCKRPVSGKGYVAENGDEVLSEVKYNVPDSENYHYIYSAEACKNFSSDHKASFTLFQNRQERGILSVCGYEWSQILNVDDIRDDSGRSFAAVPTNAEMIGVLRLLYGERIESYRKLREYSRGLLGGEKHRGFEKFLDFEKALDFEAFWQTWMRAFVLKREVKQNIHERCMFAMDSECITASQAVDGNEEWLEYRNHQIATVRGFLKNRRIAMSTTGHICLVPLNAKPGDAICILHGGRLPCVIRRSRSAGIHDPPGPNRVPSSKETARTRLDSVEVDITTLKDSGHYSFIGGCFAAGIMHGEAFKIFVDKGVKPINFKLV